MPQTQAICTLSFIPMRSEANHRSEMVSMLLFGETFTVLESKENWHRIKCSFDGYEGWITAKKLYEISEEFVSKTETENQTFVTGLPSFAVSKSNEKILLSPGSRLPLFNENSFKTGNEISYTFDGEVRILEGKEFNSTQIIKTAQLFLGTSYLWGGRSIFGIDCSGFTQVVFMMCGYKLPRDAYQQAEFGETIENLADAKAGDLAFFSERSDNRITHVGILDGNGKILHASEKVKTDSIDGKGIFNTELKEHTLKAILIKRYIV